MTTNTGVITVKPQVRGRATFGSVTGKGESGETGACAACAKVRRGVLAHPLTCGYAESQDRWRTLLRQMITYNALTCGFTGAPGAPPIGVPLEWRTPRAQGRKEAP